MQVPKACIHLVHVCVARYLIPRQILQGYLCKQICVTRASQGTQTLDCHGNIPLRPFVESRVMTVLKQANFILQDARTITSDLYDSLFLQSLLQHRSMSQAKDTFASDTTVDDRSDWQQFLDDLCFLCDSKPAGQSVVSIGVEADSSGAVFWVTTAKRHLEDAERHLKESLRLLAECSLGVLDENLAIAEITRLSVERSQDRVANYVKRLDRLILGESTRHREEIQPEGELFSLKFPITEDVLTQPEKKDLRSFAASSPSWLKGHVVTASARLRTIFDILPHTPC